MKTKMISTLEEWIPESSNWISDKEIGDHTVADYIVLGKLAEQC